VRPELTPADLADLAAVKRGGSHPDGSPCYLRAEALPDGGARLIGLGLIAGVVGCTGLRLALTLRGAVEAEARGL
jgi:hypothetical protein